MTLNRYGIPEPARYRDHLLPARRLELVIAPLLGFDCACHRLGMGGGYYDRTFSFLNQRRHIHRPLLIGLAYELQRIESLDPQPWDVRLDAVVTENRTYRRKGA
jgi:5-formyltetrahydrofolate cyclo-ligase